MVRKPQSNPRKMAIQKRSRFTVDALLDATTRILVKEGFDRASTNKIAATAGVSVGSLYQYFPSKEAVVAAVVARHAQELSRVTHATLLKVASKPLEVGVREIVVAAIEAHRMDPTLHRVLAEEVPRTRWLENIELIERNAQALFRVYLEAHRDETDVADLDLAAFMFVTTVEALTHSAVIDHPEILAGDKAEKFVDEVTRLVLPYLTAT